MPRLDLADDIAHRGQLVRRIRVRAVDHMEDHVGIGYLLEGRAERLDELVRQVAHETDGIGERVRLAVLRQVLAYGGVQRGEERVLDEGTCLRDAVEQRRLAGVRVPGNSDGWHGIAITVRALRLTSGLESEDLLAQPGHPGVDAAPVELDLRFTRTTASHAVARAHLATGLAGHRLTPTTKTREQVFELGEFHLGFALTALGMLAENIEDDGRAVDDLDLHDILERTALARGELAVDYHGVCAGCRDDIPEFDRLALAEIGTRIGIRASLHQTVENDGARGFGESGEFTHRILGVGRIALAVDADEHHTLEAQLPVFDFGDIFEFRRESRYTSQCLPVFAIELVAIAGRPRVDRLGLECLGASARKKGIT